MLKKAKQEKLDKIYKQILDNNICEVLAKQSISLVFGSGNPDADIVFIGEAPGKKEDLTGEPFVGAAGKFLNEMLDSIGLKREDVYITNIVKYRPPENRDPTTEEKEEFLPYLHAQLEVIQPKVIVTLGRHSMNCLLPGLQIGKVHGQPKKVKVNLSSKVKSILGKEYNNTEVDWMILPLYHPAAALYNGSMRKTLIDDFSEINQIIN